MVDIYGGHARIGTGDFITSSDVRYIVFFRDPIERYVSGHLYQNKVHKCHESLDQVVKKIKQKIANARENDNYMVTSSSYLLTPTQRVENEHLDVDNKLMDTVSPNITHSSTSFAAAEARAKLIIQNMYRYNAIIGLTERMPESLNMLRHILLNEPGEDLKDEAEKVFKNVPSLFSNSSPKLDLHMVGSSGTSAKTQGKARRDEADDADPLSARPNDGGKKANKGSKRLKESEASAGAYHYFTTCHIHREILLYSCCVLLLFSSKS
jgi:hypothetical protein